MRKAPFLLMAFAVVGFSLTFPPLEGECAGPEAGAFVKAVQSGDMSKVKMLLENGADIDQVNEAGWSPLLIAVHRNNGRMAELLLRGGANVKSENSEAVTPLMEAVIQGNRDMVRLLLDNDAPVDSATQGKWTPLMKAIVGERYDIADLLVARGGDVVYADKKLPLLTGFAPGTSLLNEAAKKNNLILVEWLLKQGVRPDRESKNALSTRAGQGIDKKAIQELEIGDRNGYGIYFKDNIFYAIFKDEGKIDISDIQRVAKHPWFSASSLEEVERWIDISTKGEFSGVRLVEEGYRRFNIVFFNGIYYGIAHGMGPFNDKDYLVGNKRRITGDSPEEVKAIIDTLLDKGSVPVPVLIEDGYKLYNIYKLGRMFYGISRKEKKRDIDIKNVAQEAKYPWFSDPDINALKSKIDEQFERFGFYDKAYWALREIKVLRVLKTVLFNWGV